jgi:hypothetical protein
MSFLSSVSQYTQGMSKARFSLFIFGLYMVFVAGCGFMFMPHFLLGLFGLSASDDIWIRFVGMLASIIGIYYLLVVHANLERFFVWTIPIRYYAVAFMVLMVVLGKIGAPLLAFAAVDALGATWTWISLKQKA